MDNIGGSVKATVDLKAIAANVQALRRITDPGARLMVAVKANGYGHGAVEVSRVALASGADALGVARIEEGIELRRAGIGASILIFGPTAGHWAPKLAAYGLTASVSSYEAARDLAAHVPAGKQIRVHAKIDTGMGRLGIVVQDDPPQAAVAEVGRIQTLQELVLEGVFTHFASADSAAKEFARLQFRRFDRFLKFMEQSGLKVNLRHAANSGAIIDMPETHLDMVRAGISVYGLYPSDEVDRRRVELKPAMTLKSTIVHLKQVPAGFAVSYGSTWRSPKPTTIATVAVGYADGYSRALSNCGRMLVRGRVAPVVGRVCMDLTMLDVGHIPGVAVGDEVVLIGTQAKEEISADQVAALMNTINYEVVSALTARVPRVYLT